MNDEIKTPITEAEKALRRKAVDDAQHSNDMEGVPRDPGAEHIIDAYVDGLSADEAIHRLKVHYGVTT